MTQPSTNLAPNLASPLAGGASTRPTHAAPLAIFETAAPLTFEALAARVAELAERVGLLEGKPAASLACPGTSPDEGEFKRRLSAVVSLAKGTRDSRLVCRFCGHALAHRKSLRQHLVREHRADLLALPWGFGI